MTKTITIVLAMCAVFLFGAVLNADGGLIEDGTLPGMPDGDAEEDDGSLHHREKRQLPRALVRYTGSQDASACTATDMAGATVHRTDSSGGVTITLSETENGWACIWVSDNATLTYIHYQSSLPQNQLDCCFGPRVAMEIEGVGGYVIRSNQELIPDGLNGPMTAYINNQQPPCQP